MKALLMSCGLLVALHAGAATNVVVFTNAAGATIEGEVVQVTADRVTYRTARGGGSVRLADLPAEVARGFGYDAAMASRAEELRADRDGRLRVQMAVQAEANAREYRRQRAMIEQDRAKVAVYGRVVQQLGGGVIHVRTEQPPDVPAGLYGSEGRTAWRTATTGAEGRPLANGELALAGHPRAATLVEGDLVNVAAWPDGVFNYTTVMNAGRTLKRVNCVRPALVVE